MINVSGAAVAVLRPAVPGSPYPFALVGEGVPALPLRRDQLDPALTEVTSAQLAAWADDLLDRLHTGPPGPQGGRGHAGDSHAC